MRRRRSAEPQISAVEHGGAFSKPIMNTPAPKAKTSPRAPRFQGACVPALLLLAALSPTTIRAQSSWTWNTGTGSWSNNFNWTPDTVPVSDPATQLTFEASSSYTTTNDIGTATFTLNRLTVNNTGTGTVTINGATTANTPDTSPSK